jgi:ubiquinone/menaquinone biosynthesis C-methylase UbiE
VTTSKEHSRRHFDRWAPHYEADVFSRRLAALQTEALGALELEPGDRLLDVGCGSGAAVRQAAGAVERAVGVDLSPGMIARARELAAGVANVDFREGDSEQLPFGDGEFSAVVCTTSLHHYPDLGRAVTEMARVLAPGGRVALGDGCSDLVVVRVIDAVLRHVELSHVGFRRTSELQQLLGRAGLTTYATRRLWLGGYMIVAARKP